MPIGMAEDAENLPVRGLNRRETVEMMKLTPASASAYQRA